MSGCQAWPRLQRNSTISYGELPTPQGILGNVAKLKNLAASAPRVASTAVQIEKNAINYRKFTKNNYRHNLKVFTGISPPSTMEAHHVFPKSLDRTFAKYGINVNDPKNGIWVDKALHGDVHKHGYNKMWEKYLLENKNLTTEKIYDHGRMMMSNYGLEVNF